MSEEGPTLDAMDETRKNVAATWARLLEAEHPDYVLTITDGPEGDVLYRTPVRRRAVPERAKTVSVSMPTLDAPWPPAPDAIEVLLTLSLSQYSEFATHLERLRVEPGVPGWASNTEVVMEAVRRQALGVQIQPFYTKKTLAKRLAVTERHISKLLAVGEIPSHLIGNARRIDPADVESYLARRRDEGRSASTEAKSRG